MSTRPLTHAVGTHPARRTGAPARSRAGKIRRLRDLFRRIEDLADRRIEEEVVRARRAAERAKKTLEASALRTMWQTARALAAWCAARAGAAAAQLPEVAAGLAWLVGAGIVACVVTILLIAALLPPLFLLAPVTMGGVVKAVGGAFAILGL